MLKQTFKSNIKGKFDIQNDDDFGELFKGNDGISYLPDNTL